MSHFLYPASLTFSAAWKNEGVSGNEAMIPYFSDISVGPLSRRHGDHVDQPLA